jgi:hypothetical protein
MILTVLYLARLKLLNSLDHQKSCIYLMLSTSYGQFLTKSITNGFK